MFTSSSKCDCSGYDDLQKSRSYLMFPVFDVLNGLPVTPPLIRAWVNKMIQFVIKYMALNSDFLLKKKINNNKTRKQRIGTPWVRVGPARVIIRGSPPIVVWRAPASHRVNAWAPMIFDFRFWCDATEEIYVLCWIISGTKFFGVLFYVPKIQVLPGIEI